jgi:glycosyltransferase involved in cell wall biosynthesis
MKLPKISIIMSAFNEGSRIRYAIESIQSQTFSSWDLIIVDDGSFDETSSIIKSYAHLDDRIKLIQNVNNIGLPSSLNKAIKYSKASLIARSDADDINISNRLEIQYAYMSKHPEVDILGTGAWLLGEDGDRINEPILLNQSREVVKNPLIRSYFFHPSVIIRRSFFNKIGYYNERYLLAEDLELWIRGLSAGCVYENIAEPLIEYRTGGYVKSWKSIFIRTRTLTRIVKKYNITNGYLTAAILLFHSSLIKLRLYRPKSLRK